MNTSNYLAHYITNSPRPLSPWVVHSGGLSTVFRTKDFNGFAGVMRGPFSGSGAISRNVHIDLIYNEPESQENMAL